MRKKSNKVELPNNIELIAQDLTKILKQSIEQNLEDLLNKKQEPITNKNSWFLVDFHILPENINEWSNKDFVHYFVQELNKKQQIPYVIEYSRDCSSIKKIKDQLLDINITDYNKIKDFIDWAIINYEQLKKEDDRFDLPTLNKFLNMFLQSNDVSDINNDRSLGFDILEKMNKELRDNQKNKLSILLKQFGIPLTATFYHRQGIDINKIIHGIELRLKHFGENDIIILHNIIQRSIDFSPYPNWFILINWRELFHQIIDKYHLPDLKWWRNTDYAGNFAIEYNRFKEHSMNEQ